MCVIAQRCMLYKFDINLSVTFVIDFMNFLEKFTWYHGNDFPHAIHRSLFSIKIIINLSNTKINLLTLLFRNCDPFYCSKTAGVFFPSGNYYGQCSSW